MNLICTLNTEHSFPLTAAKSCPGILKRTLDPISEDTFDDFGEYMYNVMLALSFRSCVSMSVLSVYFQYGCVGEVAVESPPFGDGSLYSYNAADQSLAYSSPLPLKYFGRGAGRSLRIFINIQHACITQVHLYIVSVRSREAAMLKTVDSPSSSNDTES